MQQNVDSSQVVQNLVAGWRSSGLKGKLIFTFIMIALFRLGAQLPVFGVNNTMILNQAGANNL
ncbi:hypothetical protein IJ670_05720, partial [bacterium]|nr:hypothetical protein [bacterium]